MGVKLSNDIRKVEFILKMGYIEIPALLLNSCVALGMILDLPTSQFPHQWNGNYSCIYLF